jgi:hypothetical protein
LFGQAPGFADDKITNSEGGTAHFNKRITQLLKEDQFAKGEEDEEENTASTKNSRVI